MMPAYTLPVQQPYNYNQNPRSTASVVRGQAPKAGVVARGQAPAEARVMLKMPAPEELGIRLGMAETPLDWNQLRKQLDEAGARSFQLEKHGAGYRFACEISGRQIEGIGRNESAAVRTALAKIK